VHAHDSEIRSLLAAIVDSSDDAIVSKTLDGVITSWNRGAERIFGYTAAEAVGRHISLIIPEDRRAEAADVLARLRRGDRIDHFETLRRTKDGREVHISLTVSPVRDAHGTIIGASKTARDITEHVRAREERERVRMLTRVLVAQEDERRRIARDLHDQLGQQLTALRLTLELLKTGPVERDKVRVQLETLEKLAEQLDRDVAFRVWELRPNELESVGLQPALTHYVQSWSRHFGIPARVHTSGSPNEHLAAEVETTIYRLAQEALNNVLKHARANRVDVVLERTFEHLSLVVEDDGVGFDQSSTVGTPGHGLGLIGMRERAAVVGADLQIESTPGRGTTVIIRVPIASPSVKSA
jgi:PAS domain S-box-containing protein